MRYYILVIVAIAYLAYVSSDACVQCDSAIDVKCATNPDAFLAKQCNNTRSRCYTRVLNGNTLRGCASDLDNATFTRCNNEMECLTCSFMEGCNRAPFPQHRAQCLQCEGNSTGLCATQVFAKPAICPIYKLGDKCYIRNDGKNNTNSFQRGCLSSALANNLCVKESNCFICEGPGCNFVEANNDQIPIARDSAGSLSFSMMLLLTGTLFVRTYSC